MTSILFAMALVVRSLPAVEGVVDCPLTSGQQVVAAYSATFEPVWHHAVPTTRVDRVAAARSGRVTGLGAEDRLVLAIEDANAAFEASHPLPDGTKVFPYSSEFVRAYAQRTGNDYVRDMMAVVAPFLGSQENRFKAVSDMYETLFALSEGDAVACRSFGADAAEAVLVVTSRARIWCWLDRRSFGDDGTAYAEALAQKGYRVDLVDRNAFSQMALESDGVVTFKGRRYPTLILRHLSFGDAAACRRLFAARTPATKVYATDAPLIRGAEITWGDPLL